MRSIKLYATGSAAANNVANVTIPSSSRLVGVQFDIYFDQVADNSSCCLELSQASATEIGVNGAQQCIAEWRSFANLVTSGLSQSALNGFYPVEVHLKQGQILYLHANTVATSTYVFNGVLWLRD